MRFARPCAALALTLLASTAIAHDFYLSPSAFAAPSGTPIALEIGVGHAFVGDPMPYLSHTVASFAARSETGLRRSIDSVEGAHPAGIVRLPEGEWTITYRGLPWIQEMEPEAFRTHLREVGHTALLEHAPATRVVQERVVRCARTIVQLGDVADTTSHFEGSEDPNDFCDLELRPLRREGDTWTIALLQGGVPLANETVHVVDVGASVSHHRHGKQRVTSADGTFHVRTRPGRRWLVTAVQVEALWDDSEADYRSDWASLSFGSPPRRANRLRADRRPAGGRRSRLPWP
ncbi:MAG: DUF4198 domain-containing protein [Acidobacteriota bacterium]